MFHPRNDHANRGVRKHTPESSTPDFFRAPVGGEGMGIPMPSPQGTVKYIFLISRRVQKKGRPPNLSSGTLGSGMNTRNSIKTLHAPQKIQTVSKKYKGQVYVYYSMGNIPTGTIRLNNVHDIVHEMRRTGRIGRIVDLCWI